MKLTTTHCIIAFLMIIGIQQNTEAQSINNYIKGHFNGSFENYTQSYMQDDKIGAFMPQDKIGSNSFLKLDYNFSKFSAGIQFESYLPSILGFFPIPTSNQSKIVNKYFKYTDNKFSVQVGDFYEQFGSGLIFRAFENRQIGINNAHEGFDIHVEPTDFLKLKVIYGRPRKLFEYANTVSRGVDAEVNINSLLKLKEKENGLSILLGGSYVSKFEEYTGAIDNFPSTINAYAGRLDISTNDLSISTEYVDKSKDPNLLNNLSFEKGKAFQLDAAYTKNNFGVTATYRGIYNMNFISERDVEFGSLAPVNYLPALTKQHDYLTSNIYVYAAQGKGESGFQTDLFYTFKSGTALGGKYGTKLSFNASLFGSLKDSNNIFGIGDEKYYRDINMEIKKKLSKKMEITIGLQQIFYNSSVIQAVSSEDVNAYVVAIGGLYKFAPKKSIRFKAEHLSTQNDQGSWASALAELSLSGPYAFYASDLFNYGKTKNHYYNFGASVTKNATRFSLGFGKQRAGLFCVGGICRFVPASYGFTASLTTSFAN